MTDPFSISAGVVGVVSLGLTVSQGFMSFYGPWKSYDEEIQDFTGKLDGLQNILKILEGFILDEDELSVVASDQYKKLVLSNLASCQTACRRLEEMLEKCKSTDCSPLVRKHDWLRLKRAAYPFKKETLVTLSQTVSGLQDNLSLALQLLNSALINQQQKQLRDIISRTVSIDSRTTTILDVVKQDKTTSDLSPSGLRQQMIVRRQSYKHPVLDPSVLHSFCNRQELINNSWRRRQQQHGLRGSDIDTISRYCACSCRPFASSSFSISVFALHEAHCPLYEAGRHTVGVAANYTLCNRLLGLSMSVMMTLTRGAGACSVSPVIQFHGLVRRSSPAFELVYHVMKGIKQGRAFEALEATRTGLLMLFREKKAAPTDRLADGSTILHFIAQNLLNNYWSWLPGSRELQSLRDLLLDMIEAGVPVNERTVDGMTVLDIFLQAGSFYTHKLQIGTRSIRLRILQDLLVSGSYMRSLNLALEDERIVSRFSSLGERYYRYGDLVHSTTRIARELIIKDPFEDFELPPIEMAIITRSTEALQSCLLIKQNRATTTDLDASDFRTLLLMCLGWVPGILLLLRSTLPRSTKAVGECFICACDRREFEAALLVLEYIDEMKREHLEAAAIFGNVKVLETFVYELSTRRYQLQELALQQLPVNTLRSLALPAEGLLDTKASGVLKALYQLNISVEPCLRANQGSLYSAVLRGGTTAADLLYTSGFTDLNQCNLYCWPPLADLGREDGPCSANSTFEQFLDLACWMLNRGADLHLQSVAGCPVVLHFAENLADRLFEEYRRSKPTVEIFVSALNSRIQLLHVDSARLLQNVLSDNSKDDCCCACLDHGCSSVTRLLSRFRTCWWKSRLPGSVFLRLQDSLDERFPGSPKLAFVSSAIRYLTFDVMQLTHTCHRSRYTLIDPEEAREIREEESELINQLEALVIEFNEKYDELGVGILEFFKGYWKTRMSEFLTPAEPDEGVLQRAQEVGVVFSGEPEASLDGVLFWVSGCE